VRQDLAANVLPGQYRLEILPAPLKAVAARLGLVTYGLNNITYTPRFGSYHQLIGLLTDAELVPAGDWRPVPPKTLAECESCEACRGACPTGAIGEDRFLLHAERCLTLHTEAAGAWPEWLTPSVHHCLVGCMYCQEDCPANAGLLRTESTGVMFSAEETATLLADDGTPGDALDGGIRAKLEKLELEDYAPMLGRNLRALMQQRT
jgi:epoxyqueuosine reductase